MKILIDLTSLYFHLSGVERYAWNISVNMIDSHPEDEFILVFTNEIHPAFQRYEGADNITMITLPCGNRLLFAQLRLPRALSRICADIYYFPAFPSPWLFRRGRTVEVIHDLSDFDCPEGKGALKVLYCRTGIRHAAKHASHIITVSEFSRKRIMTVLGTGEDRVSTAYGGVLTGAPACTASWDVIRKKYSLPERYILTVSTLEPRKDLKILIGAFGKYCLTDSVTGLVLCGRAGWNMKEALGEGADNGRITVTGFVDDSDLPSVYAHAEAFVFPSKYEGFGLPPLEAMAQGCTVISSDAPAMPEILGDAAVWFESGSEDSLLDALGRTLEMDETEKALMKEKGLMRAAAFSWSGGAARTYEIIRSAAGTERGGK